MKTDTYDEYKKYPKKADGGCELVQIFPVLNEKSGIGRFIHTQSFFNSANP